MTEISEYRDRHAGQTGLVICNGPSLNKVDFGRVHLPTIGANRIYLKLTPDYYVVEDHLVAEDFSHDIRHLQTVKFYGSHLSHYGRLADDPLGIWYETHLDTDYPTFPNWTIEPPFWTGGTVTYQMLLLAFYMGFETIYLVGLDHKYIIPDHASTVDGSIYQLHGKDPNHFDPTYFQDGRMHDPHLERMEKAYRRATQQYTLAGRHLYNATPGTSLPDYIIPTCPLDEVYR